MGRSQGESPLVRWNLILGDCAPHGRRVEDPADKQHSADGNRDQREDTKGKKMRSRETALYVVGRARVRGPGGILLGILLLCVGALALWVVLMVPNVLAQEPSQEPSPAPSVPAPAEEVTPPQPKEPRPEPGPPPGTPPPAKELTLKTVLPDISGLVIQPLFLAIKLPVAVMGGVVGGVLWPFGGENHEGAQKVWNATVGPPWVWPEFVRGIGGQSPPP